MVNKRGHNLNGRQKGVKNKLGKLAKDNIADVFDHVGGIAKMVEWAQENQTEFYKIYARLIPVQIEGSGDNGEIKITIEHVTCKTTDS